MANRPSNSRRPANGAGAEIEKESASMFPLVKTNFILMAIAGLMIVVGFILMAGKGSTPTEFNPDIFSPRRVVVGPTISFLGFLFMGYAIMWSGKKNSSAESTDEPAK